MQLSTASSHSMLLVLIISARAHAQAPSMGASLCRAQASTNLKSANIFVHADFSQSAKFSSHQIFRLYSITQKQKSHFHCSSPSVYYSECQVKNKYGGGLGKRLCKTWIFAVSSDLWWIDGAQIQAESICEHMQIGLPLNFCFLCQEYPALTARVNQ